MKKFICDDMVNADLDEFSSMTETPDDVIDYDLNGKELVANGIYE